MSYNSKYKGSEVEELLDSIGNKVDKEDGKQLSTEDFTTLLKQKLEGLSNYDDTTINQAVQSLQTQLNTLVSGNASTAVESFNEIIAFLEGIEDSESLDSIIASIEKQLLWEKAEGEAGIRLKGTNGTATGTSSISAGDDKTASDGKEYKSVASGDHAVAFGYGNTCSGRTTLAQGLYNIVTGKDCVAFGQKNTVGGQQAFAVGMANEITAPRNGIALGYGNTVTVQNGVAIGWGNVSNGDAAIAMGDACEASATSAVAMGYQTKASGNASVTFGKFTKTTGVGETAMGEYNLSVTSNNAAEQTSFSFGIGTSDTNRINAFEIKKNGDVYIGNKLLSDVATSGSYNDLTDKPTIPSAVTESTVSGWGFTKNTGTYSKPSTGIPKSDLASAVQTSLGKADTALQEHQDLSGKQDNLVSGTNIKTINGESILGEGDIVIEGSAAYPIEFHGSNDTIFEITPNIYHVWDLVTSLTLTLAPETDSSVCNEYVFEFSSGSTATTLSLPSTIKWVNAPNIKTGVTYQVSIVNGLGVIAGFSA